MKNVKYFTVCMVVIFTLVLSACSGNQGGSQGGNQGSETPPIQDQEKNSEEKVQSVTLIYNAWSQPYIDWVTWAAEQFNESRPDLDFKLQTEQSPFGDYWDRLRTKAAGNNLPDILDMNIGNFLDYVTRDQLLSLQPYYEESDINKDDFVGAVWDQFVYEDEVYAITTSMDAFAIYYNKDIFDELNVPYPIEQMTLTEFRDLAKQMTVPGKYYGSLMSFDSQEAMSFMYSNGGKFYDAERTKSLFNSPENLEVFTMIYEMMHTDKSIPNATEWPTTGYMSDLFSTGKIAMIPASLGLRSRMGEVEFDWDFAPMPKGPAGLKTAVASPGRAVSANTKHPDIAAEFVMFLARSEMIDHYSKERGFSTRFDSQKNILAIDESKELRHFIDSVQDAELYPNTLNFNTWFNNVFQVKAGDMALGLVTPEEFIKETDKAINEALKNN